MVDGDWIWLSTMSGGSSVYLEVQSAILNFFRVHFRYSFWLSMVSFYSLSCVIFILSTNLMSPRSFILYFSPSFLCTLSASSFDKNIPDVSSMYMLIMVYSPSWSLDLND